MVQAEEPLLVAREGSEKDSSTAVQEATLATTTTTTTDPVSSSTQHVEGGEVAKRPRRVIRRKKRPSSSSSNTEAPPLDPVLFQKVLSESGLPKAYSFEIEKSVQRIQTLQASHVALQMPEGLLLYATVLADALIRLAAPFLQDISILGDVTYGACCVGDLDAQALGAQLLIHYGHSCLVPIQHTVIPCLYVFVEIQIDIPHCVDCLDITLQNLTNNNSSSSDTNNEQRAKMPHIYMLGTVQFRHALVEAKELLMTQKNYQHVSIPQVKPLSPGEVLGCTSPTLHQHTTKDAVVCFVADGRFHLESTLISNPHITKFYRYDPYGKSMTEESYDHKAMHTIRQTAVHQAAAKTAQTFGIILGTLGRQGNPAIVRQIQTQLKQHGKRSFLMLLSEITPAKLQLFADTKVDAWVQVACPRLSVDWGHYLSNNNQPVLTPYELSVCLGETTWKDVYPMDYYSLEGGPWSNYHPDNKLRQI